jgi:Tfp pilus assembly pilus retraction ATPase PilT
MQTGRAHGMKLLDISLQELVAQGLITREAALANADNKKLFDGAPNAAHR